MKLYRKSLSKLPDYIHKLSVNPPEQRNDREATRSRVISAVRLYEENFDEYGLAVTKKGQDLSRRHGFGYWEDYPYTINGLLKWIRKAKNAFSSYFKSEKRKQLEVQMQLLSDDIIRLRRKVGDLEDAVYKEDDQ
jgi:hypothetical protein